MKEEAMIQNLKDAGCDNGTIQKFLTGLHAGNTALELKRLAAHRRNLLSALHAAQRQIDCLDYLTFQLKRETQNKTTK